MPLTPLDRTALSALPVFRDYATDSDGRPAIVVKEHACACGHAWTDHWSCGCDDECPECGVAVGAEEFGPDPDLPDWALQLWEVLPEEEDQIGAPERAISIRAALRAPGIAAMTGERIRDLVAETSGWSDADWQVFSGDPGLLRAVTRRIALALVETNAAATT